MPHTCHRCGTLVDDAKPFCSQCGAPQIRVPAPGDLPEDAISPPPLSSVASRHSIVWSSALPKSAAAGFASIVLMYLLASISPVLQFLAIPLVSTLMVWLYARGQGYPALPAATGMRLGLVTGFMCFLVSTIILAAQITSDREQFYRILRDAIQQAAARQSAPQSQQLVEQLMSPGGITMLLVLGGILGLFVFLVLGSIGGTLAASSLRNRRRRLG